MTYRSQSIDRLYDVISKLDSREACFEFFSDLCTIKELQDMAQRLDAAILLSQGKSYQTITQQVGISTATIGRVSKCLNYGTGGYKKAIDGLSQTEDK